jgi:Mrp family chromosome partitioning ATPase/uncharacterized protein involved in exopolysaccharide biosynthesis
MTLGDRIDHLVKLGRHALAFRYRILIVVAAGAIASALVAGVRPRVYRSETLIQYREGIRASAVVGSDGNTEPARKLGLKLRENLLSRSHLAQLIDELHLYPDVVTRRGQLDAVEEMRRNIAFSVRDGEVFDLSFTGDDPHRVQRVTARLADDLVRANDQGRIEQASITRDFLDGEMRSSDEELARKETELARFLAAHPELAREPAGGDLGAGIRAEQERRRGAPIAVDPELLALERQAARIEHRLGLLATSRKELAADADPKTVAARAEADAELSAARRELADRLTQLTEQHPDVRAARLKVRAAELRVQRANDAVAASALAGPPSSGEEEPAAVSSSRNDLDRINAEIAAWRQRRRRVGTSPTVLAPVAQEIVAMETEWTRLRREVARARARHEEVEAKQFKAAMVAKSIASEGNLMMVVIDPAYLPRHALPPGRTTIFVGGLAISLALALAVALVSMLLDDRIRDRSDVEQMEIVRLLAVVPKVANAPPSPPPPPRIFRKPKALHRRTARWPQLLNGPAPVVLANEQSPMVWVDLQRSRAHTPDPLLSLLGASDSPAAAGFRLLRHRLRRDGDPRVIAVTSAHTGDGKSTCAANLALALAEGGRARVLLIEADLRSPGLATLFQVTPPACFALQLEHHRDKPVDPWVVVELAPEPVHLAALGPATLSRQLDAATFQLALTTLRLAGYDYVVLDSPSVLDSADIHLVEECVDGVLLVARAGHSSARGLRRAAERLSSAKLIGLGLLDA